MALGSDCWLIHWRCRLETRASCLRTSSPGTSIHRFPCEQRNRMSSWTLSHYSPPPELLTWSKRERFHEMRRPMGWCRWCRWSTVMGHVTIRRWCQLSEILSCQRCRHVIWLMGWPGLGPLLFLNDVMVVLELQYCWRTLGSVFDDPFDWMWRTPELMRWCHRSPRIYRPDLHTCNSDRQQNS